MKVVLLLFSCFLGCLSRDPYEVLDVAKDASQGEIRRAYKKLALEHHPDKNNQETSDLFTEINSAYEILGPQILHIFVELERQP